MAEGRIGSHILTTMNKIKMKGRLSHSGTSSASYNPWEIQLLLAPLRRHHLLHAATDEDEAHNTTTASAAVIDGVNSGNDPVVRWWRINCRVVHQRHDPWSAHGHTPVWAPNRATEDPDTDLISNTVTSIRPIIKAGHIAPKDWNIDIRRGSKEFFIKVWWIRTQSSEAMAKDWNIGCKKWWRGTGNERFLRKSSDFLFPHDFYIIFHFHELSRT
jgi:hypothetical protein